ncbi:hypothetical protein SAMN04515647_0533 [Cohaesibacter sp. ES.047]|uniref:cupin domain-containing protein n=1 Tax=Cohaesibacter sp. ES.047 TaxID=1798205 RepID=UPI000BB89F9E|nr:cupin domain-containing protein [Cohaesibacter sp. ES.047]SNY90369.1 hypothetical protein SAMN04515647_0533 [Cohaesibacter sp. ES.047]
MASADEIIAALDMQPHPEGGYFVETFRDDEGSNGRGHCTAIYFLLKAGERSHWHRVDAVESWFWHDGAPLSLKMAENGQNVVEHNLGPDILNGQAPQAIVPKNAWQSAQSLGDWTLVSCVVAPAFQFEGFTLAPEGWEPDGSSSAS